jgi:hypothetical protein
MENLTYTLKDIQAANALNVDLVEGDVRPLGSFEHLFWLLDQGSPMHFSLAAEIEAHATVGIGGQPWTTYSDVTHFSLCASKKTDGPIRTFVGRLRRRFQFELYRQTQPSQTG